MRLANVRPGDTIEAKVRGYRFPAKVIDLDCRDIPSKPIRIQPLVPNVTFFHLAAHQVAERIDPPPGARR